MFDEDFLGRGYASDDCFAHVDPVIEQAKFEAAALDLPFDLQNIIDNNPFVFGKLGTGPLIGRTVRYPGGMISNLCGESLDVGPGVGTVIGDAFGRVVLAFENACGQFSYLGWIDASEVEIVFVHREARTWTH